MASFASPDGTMTRPVTVFDAVSKHDTVGIVEHYLKNARHTIQSSLALKKRWCGHRQEDMEVRSEQKLDEYFQHIADESARWSLQAQYNSSFQSVASGTVPPQHRQQTQSGPRHQEDEASLHSALAEIDALLDSTQSTASFDGKVSPVGTSRFAGGECRRSLDGGDRVVWQSVNVLSNSRPPANFVVFNRNGDIDTEDGGDEYDDERELRRNDSMNPPIFDGQVANATPPPLGPTGIRPSAGSGTLLHLSCAVDCSFGLAVALALGADARSPHTAFRRLMMHEAACCGSSKCLQLLLELGEDSAYEMYGRDQLTNVPRRNTHTRKPDVIPCEESKQPPSVPFFPFEDGEHGLRHRHQHLSMTPKSQSTSGCGIYEGAKAYVPRGKKFSSWLELLREFLFLARQVERGLLSEFDAARLVLSHDTMSDATKDIIAQSCSFLVKDAKMAGNPYHCAWFADGHGNTPLHWAAFKNEQECVALLLKYHADPNARARPSGWTPLHDAAYSNSSESLAHLLNAGADVDIRANSGATPLCFAAQEDSDEAARLLLERGADMSKRCSMGPMNGQQGANQNGTAATPGQADGGVGAGRPANNQGGNAQNGGGAVGGGGAGHHGRFSGYSALHYCAHYNAHRAAKVLLLHRTAKIAMEMPDVTGRLPIHVAVARGSSDVLRELLHAGARVDMPFSPPTTPKKRRPRSTTRPSSPPTPERVHSLVRQAPRAQTPPRTPIEVVNLSGSDSGVSTTPVSSPVLRSMIPSRPITSSKPWNCLTQRSINECRDLIAQSEQSWTPDRHSLFTPEDRAAVLELLRVGKRLEQNGTGIFLDLWPTVLSFCGRGWFVIEPRVVVVANRQDEVETVMLVSPSSPPSLGRISDGFRRPARRRIEMEDMDAEMEDASSS
eukprot:CAMPEP_0194028046 /NCGR_PEP_ID=MMETSP0009_2-20130614/2073_1 /TAXON_ID=210454 /ORGANISM="Grammatophora oceanica, Strain CCMP 410" /LENGTH=895 /DNA_ID=CAMNT_0038667295 /DNA_START=32 /DNA_END=2719 /DNA_ORIENTATION=+